MILLLATPIPGLNAQDSVSSGSSSKPAAARPLSLTQIKIEAATTFKTERPTDTGEFLIDADNATIDFLGSTIVGASDTTPADQFVGRAIVIRKAKNVTLKNVNIHGFKVAIYAEDAPGLRLENCDVSRNYRMHLKSTPQREHRDDWLWPHKNDDNEWLRYGAGIYLLRCDDAKIVNCKARNGQNGICLTKCNGVEITGNDMSFMSGWGLALYRTSKSRVIGNRFDYCVRGYSHGVYNRGQDSAGILVFEQSSDNLFAYNSATHGGDGFFLYGGDETLKVTGQGGCNRNVLYKNDFSYAVMHGIEATFSDQNVFVGNILAHCENGIWAGYSTRSTITQNQFSHCKTGVAIEHGRENKMEWNDFIDCKRGIWLWWDEDKELFSSQYVRKNSHASNREEMRWNYFSNCAEAVVLGGSTEATLESSQMLGCAFSLLMTDDASIKRIEENDMGGGVIENRTQNTVRAEYNKRSHREKGPIELANPAKRAKNMRYGRRRMLPLDFEPRLPPNPPQVPESLTGPRVPQRRELVPSPGLDSIFIDEWGPYDFGEPRLFPSRFSSSPPFTANLLGTPGMTFNVLSGIDPHFQAIPLVGHAPSKITIAPRKADNAPPPGVYQFDLDVRIGKVTHRLPCVAFVAPWNVKYFKWDQSQDPLANEENWKKIIATAPKKTEQRDNLDLPFGSGGPTPEIREHFALTAETRLNLPPGKWRLRTISDDGVRVYFDGKRVIDNWTWHVPTEDTAVVEVKTKGEYGIRVEYFEITGHAQLQFILEPAALK